MNSAHPVISCARCGIRREVNVARGYDPMCLDCILVERDLAALCGTDRGYHTHLTNGEIACRPCLDAHNRRDEENRRKRGVKPRRKAECGTNSGYFAHRYRKQQPCDSCRAAHNEYDKFVRNRAKEAA